MGNFNRGGGGGRSFGRRDFRSENRPMFKTTCSNCGNECEVPFRPTSGKPVYCSNCFERMGNARSDSPRQERPSFRAPSVSQNNDQFGALNTKLDKILKLLEEKTSEAIVSTPGVVEKVKSPKSKKISPAKEE